MYSFYSAYQLFTRNGIVQKNIKYLHYCYLSNFNNSRNTVDDYSFDQRTLIHTFNDPKLNEDLYNKLYKIHPVITEVLGKYCSLSSSDALQIYYNERSSNFLVLYYRSKTELFHLKELFFVKGLTYKPCRFYPKTEYTTIYEDYGNTIFLDNDQEYRGEDVIENDTEMELFIYRDDYIFLIEEDFQNKIFLEKYHCEISSFETNCFYDGQEIQLLHPFYTEKFNKKIQPLDVVNLVKKLPNEIILNIAENLPLYELIKLYFIENNGHYIVNKRMKTIIDNKISSFFMSECPGIVEILKEDGIEISVYDIMKTMYKRFSEDSSDIFVFYSQHVNHSKIDSILRHFGYTEVAEDIFKKDSMVLSFQRYSSRLLNEKIMKSMYDTKPFISILDANYTNKGIFIKNSMSIENILAEYLDNFE
ncbi:MAG TPA: HAD hydrolase family protein [Allocoleopsis sp.]